MAEWTRRGFIRASAIGAGLLTGAGGISKLLAQTSSGCSISSNFNGTSIQGGDFIWFNSVVKVSGLGGQPVTVCFAGLPIQFTVGGVRVTVPLPPSSITFSPDVVLATTDFVAGQWVTTVLSAGLSGNVFLGGAAFRVPSGGLPGGIKNVTWQGMFYSATPGVTAQWKWSAAAYHCAGFMDQGYAGLGVKPVDDGDASPYKNSDHAGTPENFRRYVVGGARGGGGSSYTGSYSGTTTCDCEASGGCGYEGGGGS